MVEKFEQFAGKVRALNEDDEAGMETAQVILILFVVVALFLAVFVPLRNNLSNKGDTINEDINK